MMHSSNLRSLVNELAVTRSADWPMARDISAVGGVEGWINNTSSATVEKAH